MNFHRIACGRYTTFDGGRFDATHLTQRIGDLVCNSAQNIWISGVQLDNDTLSVAYPYHRSCRSSINVCRSSRPARVVLFFQLCHPVELTSFRSNLGIAQYGKKTDLNRRRWFVDIDHRRPHSSLDGKSPDTVCSSQSRRCLQQLNPLRTHIRIRIYCLTA